MPFENRQYMNLLFQHAIDDAIAAHEHLTNVVAPELGDTPSTRWHRGCRPSSLTQAIHPAARGRWIISSNVLGNGKQLTLRAT